MLRLMLKSDIGLLQPILLLFAYARPKFGPHGLGHVHHTAAFQSIVISVLLNGAETWTLLNKHCAALCVCLISCLRHFCGISLKDHISNAAILSMCQPYSMDSQLRIYTVIELPGAKYGV